MKMERMKDGHYTIHYSSFNDLLTDKIKGGRKPHPTCAMRNWYGPECNTQEGFVQKVQNGWPELTDKVREMASRLAFKPDTLTPTLTAAMRRRRVRTDAGSDLDIHAVYQGQIDRAWQSTRRELHQVRRRAAHVYIAIGGLATESAEASLWRAAAAYRICELLQRSGFTVEITVGSSATGVYPSSRMAYVHTSFTAKPSNMPLDMNRLALQATLGWHRVYSFKARECNDAGYATASSMGCTAHNIVPPFVRERMDAGDLVVLVPSNVDNEQLARDAVQHAQNQLEALGK